jgi:hypothetical protein
MPERRAYARTGRLYMSSHRPFGRDSQFSRSYGYDSHVSRIYAAQVHRAAAPHFSRPAARL